MSSLKTILQTRARWYRFFIAAEVVSVTVAVICFYLTGQYVYSIAPVAILGLWARIRLATPAVGTQMATIEGNLWIRLLLGWLGICLASFVCFFQLDRYVLNHQPSAPLLWYHWVFGISAFSIMVAGCVLIEKRYKSRMPS